MYSTKYCEVSYLAQYNVVFVKWKAYCEAEDYRAPLLYALEIIREHEGCNYVADTRSGFVDAPADTLWVADYFMPKAAEYGCKTIFFIINENNELKDELEGQATDSADIMEFCYIYDLSELAS